MSDDPVSDSDFLDPTEDSYVRILLDLFKGQSAEAIKRRKLIIRWSRNSR